MKLHKKCVKTKNCGNFNKIAQKPITGNKIKKLIRKKYNCFIELIKARKNVNFDYTKAIIPFPHSSFPTSS